MLARFAIVLHALLALALGGAVTHLALVTLALATGHPKRWRAPKFAGLYGQVAGALFVVTFAIGALVYPAYRYKVRGLYLDRYFPWASNLFDMKEVLAALALPMAVTLFVLGRSFSADSSAATKLVFYVYSWIVFGVVAFDIVSGLVIVSVKSV